MRGHIYRGLGLLGMLLAMIAMHEQTDHDQHEPEVDDIIAGLDEEQLREPDVVDLLDLEERTTKL